MNNNDIYQKSELGREEIKNQSLGVLPREARTLLIMIDGKKTYQNYLNSLDSSKMFADFGGITPLFELLLEFQCIELAEQVSTSSLQQVPKPKKPAVVTSALSSNKASSSTNYGATAPPSQTTQSQSNQFNRSQIDSEAEFEKTFNNKQADNSVSSAANTSKRLQPDVNYETLKSSLATFIEKNAPPEDAWGYLLDLEQCSETSQLLALAKNIQGSSSGSLSRSMEDFLSKHNRQF
ncbi:hypothetical protein [uncultured Psychrobacter sp.]|uniref:hypothetical protein n=1 Tax=uncultured Psychrobacter sp. TaxID=259303 RepID=UPI00345A9D60